MKKIGQFINLKRKKPVKKSIDEKTIFFLFNQVVREMYGDKGVENLKAKKYSGQTLFFSSRQPLWAADILVNQKEVIDKINKQIGSLEVKEIKSIQ